MSRITDELLGDVAWKTAGSPMQLDPLKGGQFGYSTNPQEWISAQAYLPMNLIPIVLEAPEVFQKLPNPEKWVQAWRLLFEKHARTIEGLKAGLTVDTAEHAFGAAGEFFEEITDVKRERSTLSIGLVDKAGNVWQNYLERLIMYGMMHPETKVPLSATLDDVPSEFLAPWYSGTIAFIEPDPMHKKALRCWISTNVFPKGTGPIEGRLDKTSPRSIKELSLDFASLNFYGEGTRSLGQQLLDAMNLTRANPHLRASYIREISADVAAVTSGYKESVETNAKNQVGNI